MRIHIDLTAEMVSRYNPLDPLALVEEAIYNACGLKVDVIHNSLAGWKMCREGQASWYPVPATLETICRSYLFHRKPIEVSHLAVELEKFMFWPILQSHYMGDDGKERLFGNRQYTYTQEGDEVIAREVGIDLIDDTGMAEEIH